nr:UbiA family prenyltransferase [Lacticaseibacillus absianus]
MASLLPFALGVSYAWYARGQFDAVNTAVYFVGQMSIAIFVTGFNNVQDWFKSQDPAYRAKGNIIGTAHLSPYRVLALMLTFLVVACGAGAFLVWRTDLSLLLVGGAAILIAVCYTFGPVPLSRLPIGEVASGLTEGLGTIFIAYYVNVTPYPLTLRLSGRGFIATADLQVLLTILVVALPIVILDGTIMFANNICDIDEDIVNQRQTLAVLLGHDRSLRLYPWLPVAAFACLTLGVGLRLLPWPMLLVWGVWPRIRRNVRKFLQVQVRRLTFNTAVGNLLMTAGAEVAVLCAVNLWQGFR